MKYVLNVLVSKKNKVLIRAEFFTHLSKSPIPLNSHFMPRPLFHWRRPWLSSERKMAAGQQHVVQIFMLESEAQVEEEEEEEGK